ncbi:hypothetical protein [Aestuariibaculum sediminum]|uniref:Carboxypeptidase regulatory-like domain-containing protein n=1 Tax=Aestuariibaculum sediminum TaxID=2770637 RepID=A0A8J6Q197_9FLAO|nr:hypothetical protein [Aestuariibaculum sediminum]MBD0830899.1 hypothetical protein [Aestuariibaculum sediminum]
MKSSRYSLTLFLFTLVMFNAFFACSSEDNSGDERIELNILVLDSNSQEPISGARIEVCNNALFCTNILASGTTNADGKIRLFFSRKADKMVSESFSVYKDDYRSSTYILDQLDISQEIVVTLKKY